MWASRERQKLGGVRAHPAILPPAIRGIFRHVAQVLGLARRRDADILMTRQYVIDTGRRCFHIGKVGSLHGNRLIEERQ